MSQAMYSPLFKVDTGLGKKTAEEEEEPVKL